MRMTTRITAWLAVTVATAFCAYVAFGELDHRRRPETFLASSYVAGRLGELAPAQRRLVDGCIASRPLESMIAAYGGGYGAMEQLAAEGPTSAQTIAAMALRRCLPMTGEATVDSRTADQFVRSAATLFCVLDQVDQPYAQQFLGDLEQLSPLEYSNVAWDPSYVQVVRQLDPRWRDEFRRNQDILTPLLTCIVPDQWNGLMGQFAAAQPRIGQMLRDPQLGAAYASVYMLHRDAVHSLQGLGIDEPNAIEFVGINASVLCAHGAKDPAWPGWVKILRETKDQKGKSTLFDWACTDSTIFSILMRDTSPQKALSLAVLKKYAGSELPAILTLQYSADGVFSAALDSLVRLEKDENQQAAKFLMEHQGSEDFKQLLAKHGFRLIAALSTGKTDLEHVKSDAGWVDKCVDEDGKSRGTPLWTYLPGGNIALVIREVATGRPLTSEEIAWAVVDGAAFILVMGKGAQLVKGGLTIVQGAALRQGAKATLRAEASLVARSAGSGAAKGVLLRRAYGLLEAAGKKMAPPALRLARKAASFAVDHPLKAALTGLAIYVVISRAPEIRAKAESVADQIMNRGLSAAMAQALAQIPADIIDGIFDAIAERASRRPMLAVLYYGLGATILLALVAVPLALLRWLVRPLYDAFGAVLRGIFRPLGWLVQWVRARKPAPR